MSLLNWETIEVIDRQKCPAWVEPNDSHLTLVKIGKVKPESALKIKGANKEDQLFEKSKTGRYNNEDFKELVKSLKEKGCLESILILADSQGVHVSEGNHRIRACFEAGTLLYEELRCFGEVEEKIGE
jgi:hypothetical protein